MFCSLILILLDNKNLIKKSARPNPRKQPRDHFAPNRLNLGVVVAEKSGIEGPTVKFL